jgi:hypothetical protein
MGDRNSGDEDYRPGETALLAMRVGFRRSRLKRAAT